MNEIPPPDVRLHGKVRIVEWNSSPRETDKDFSDEGRASASANTQDTTRKAVSC